MDTWRLTEITHFIHMGTGAHLKNLSMVLQKLRLFALLGGGEEGESRLNQINKNKFF